MSCISGNLFEIDLDPRTGAGVAAELSTFARDNSEGGGSVYWKTGPLDTDWRILSDFDSAVISATNLGNLGEGVYDSETGNVLGFRNIAPGTHVTVALDGDHNIVLDTTGLEVELTFSDGLTRTSNTVRNNLITGIAGGNQTVVGGTGTFETLNLKPNSFDSSYFEVHKSWLWNYQPGVTNNIFTLGSNDGSVQIMQLRAFHSNWADARKGWVELISYAVGGTGGLGLTVASDAPVTITTNSVQRVRVDANTVAIGGASSDADFKLSVLGGGTRLTQSQAAAEPTLLLDNAFVDASTQTSIDFRIKGLDAGADIIADAAGLYVQLATAKAFAVLADVDMGFHVNEAACEIKAASAIEAGLLFKVGGTLYGSIVGSEDDYYGPTAAGYLGLVDKNSKPFLISDGASVWIYGGGSTAPLVQVEPQDWTFKSAYVWVENGSLHPLTDNVTELGDDTHRWSLVRGVTITSGDLELGYPDGEGEWVLREGPEHVYAHNRRSGKKYRLAMEEVPEGDYFPAKYAPTGCRA